MRAPFDRLIDLYYGPDTNDPLVLRMADVPARFVIEDAFFDRGDPFTQVVGYLTMDAIEPSAPEVTDQFGLDYTIAFGTGDFVALAPGAPVTHQVLRAELRTWQTGENYYRAHVAPLLTVAPSECSYEYAQQYRCWDQYTRDFIVNRIGPVTWTYNEWTLSAETLGPPGTGCFSRWILSNGVHTWNSDYYGGEEWSFYSPDGGTPITFIIIPQ